MKRFFLILFSFLLSSFLLADNNLLYTYLLPAREKVQISDWLNPSYEDYVTLQNYLYSSSRPELKFLDSIGDFRQKRMREFCFISPLEKPRFETLCINTDASNKEKCVVTYISYNRNYKNGLDQLIQALKNTGYKGHVIYRIGGWPNTQNGCLEHFDVPYAFKVCAILEAKNLGYENCLWLDASILPLKNIDIIFDSIKKNGMFFFAYDEFSMKNFCPSFVCKELGCSLDDLESLTTIGSAVVGFNFSNIKALNLLDAWHQLAINKIGFLSFVPEMAPLSILINKMGFLKARGDRKYYTYTKPSITSDTILFVDWDSVK